MSRRNRRASRRGGNYNNDKRNGEDDEQEIIRIHNEEENNFGGNIVHVVFLILPVHKTKCAVKNGARTNFGLHSLKSHQPLKFSVMI